MRTFAALATAMSTSSNAAASNSISSNRRWWKPSARLESAQHDTADHNAQSDISVSTMHEHELAYELSNEEQSMLLLEASSSSAASTYNAATDAHSNSSSARVPNSESSRLELLEYRSTHHSRSNNTTAHASRTTSATALPLVSHSSSPALLQTPLLFPVLVVPQHVSRAREVQHFLDRIERIEITSVIERDDNVVYYVLDVYRYRQQNGIPTERRRAATELKRVQSTGRIGIAGTNTGTTGIVQSHIRTPDYQIEHRYSSFARLRSNVSSLARKRHRDRRVCSYCDPITAFFATSDAQPSLHVKFRTTIETRTLLLCAFINALLVATRASHAECVRSQQRGGFHPIPALMKRFLHEQSGENFFS